jgi:putative transposase
MPRKLRSIAPGLPHLVIHRAAPHTVLFRIDRERKFYLQLIAKCCQKERMDLLGYCLLPTETRLILVPPSTDTLSRALGRAHYNYSLCTSMNRNPPGPLFHGRFQSSALHPNDWWQTLLDLELAPVHNGLAQLPQHFRWSSAAAHAGIEEPPPWLALHPWNTIHSPRSWQCLLGSTALEPGNRLVPPSAGCPARQTR